jgi:ribonuclease Z
MGRIVILGSASAVPDEEQENTHLLVEAGSRIVLIDCPGSPVIRLQKAGIEMNGITDIILTHFHPDHASGFAPLLMSMWLTGRKHELNVYGLADTLNRAQQMMSLYHWEDWPGFYPVNFVPVAAEELSPVFSDTNLKVIASPVAHLVPTIGLRFDFLESGRTVAYSCDTEPSQIVCRLAENADILIHESTGASMGHTSPEQAGEIATQAGAGMLYLIHYSSQRMSPELMLEKARKTFSGPVEVAKDFMSISIDR